ncbi:MAG: hydroxymethylbilane synthase [Ponticaulis sp.]|nr:hydroxymethylbilane synthase [Ponticaulis sp.]|tara:strand:- start:10188 stop:11135 length:948 start_codon:yes stop_codon:yes gene_type:complete
MTLLKLGTRNSPLALAQARWVAAEIEAILHGDVTCKIVGMTTSGDQLQDRSLIEAGGKGLFTKELDIALEQGEVDILVHSLKDVPVELPLGQRILAYPAREDPRDAFISLKYGSISDLPEGATVGTSSLRRRAFLLAKRPDLNVVEFRGNVQTRLKKLEEGVAEATFLACAGLRRLGMGDTIRSGLDPKDFLPAVGQGILAIAAYPERLNPAAADCVRMLNDAETERAALAERAALGRLDGSCRTPIAAHLFHDGPGCYRLVVQTADPSGKPFYSAEKELEGLELFLQDFRKLGEETADLILDQAGGRLPHLEDV